MAVKVNGTTVIDDSRNVCAVSVCACCIESSSTVTIPSGNTASRPTGGTGELFFDTDEGKLIAYDGSDWASVGGGGYPQIAAHCNAVPTINASATQDRQVKAPVPFNNMVHSISGSYKASNPYNTSLFIGLKTTGTTIELCNVSGGGGNGGIVPHHTGASFISPDKNFYSFSTGGESSFCVCGKSFGFTPEKIYQMTSCNRSTSLSSTAMTLGAYSSNTKIFGIHASGHFGMWCCTGALICMGRICKNNQSFANAYGLFTTCSGDIGLFLCNSKFIVHLDVDDLSIQCQFCYTITEPTKMDGQGGAPAETTTAVGWPGCCKYGYVWDKVNCCMYNIISSNGSNQFNSKPVWMSVNDSLYFKTFGCQGGQKCCTKLERVNANGTRDCYIRVCGGLSYFWNDGPDRFIAQNLGEKLISIHGTACTGGIFMNVALSVDVSVSHSAWKSGILDCIFPSGGAMNCTASPGASQGTHSTYVVQLNCMSCIKCCLCVTNIVQ